MDRRPTCPARCVVKQEFFSQIARTARLEDPNGETDKWEVRPVLWLPLISSRDSRREKFASGPNSRKKRVRKSREGRKTENEREVEREREKENLQPADRREDVEQRKTSHPTPGGSETPRGDSERVERALLTPRGDKLVERAMRSTSAGEGEEREELGQTVAPSPETSTTPKGRDFVGAEGSMEKKHSEAQREGSSPPDNIETHGQGNGALSTEMKEEVVISREAEKIEEEEMKEDETTEGGESETYTEPTLGDEEVVDQKGVEEVLKMLAETDWEIEPVEEREGEETPRPAVTVPVEKGAHGKVAEIACL